MALRFAQPAGAAEPREPHTPPPAEATANPESDLWRVVDTAHGALDLIGHRIDRGQQRAGTDYRVTPAELARMKTLFREGLEAVATYERRRRT